MASGRLRDDEHTKFSPTSPHFFKIILEDTLQNKKLQIPKRIVSRCGATLKNSIVLELPCGLQWEVGLTKCDGKLWIEKGWPEFADYCSLERGNLLVFRCEGNSQFNVLIFDKSTTEIDYPPNDKLIETQPKHDQFVVKEEGTTQEDDDSVEILENFSLSKSLILQSSRPHKRRRTTRPLELGGQKSNVTPKWRKCGDVRRRQSLTEKEKAQALVRARLAVGFKSKYPFFMVVMQPSFVGGAKFDLNLPFLFTTKYLGSKNAEVMLKLADQNRTWSVKYTFGVYDKYPRARFVTGWREFARDNDLKVGDVCAFVLTKRIQVLFEVSILRKNGTSNSPVHKAATFEARPRGGHPSKVKSCNVFRSETPFFTITMRASYAASHASFHIPCKFATAHIHKNEGKAILAVSDGRSWPVLYRVRDRLNRSPTAEFCRGWNAFVRDNCLKEGDVCTFELIHGNDLFFKVSIVKPHDHLTLAGEKATKPVKPKKNASAKLESGCTRNKEICSFGLNLITKKEQEEIVVEQADIGKFRKLKSKNCSGSQVTWRPSSSGVRRASEAASKFCSKYPYFRVDLASRYLGKKRALHIPLHFARSYLETSQTATLSVGGRSWPVKIAAYPWASYYRLSRGWSAFFRENSLSPGDICIFELVNRKQIVFKVSIYSEN